MDILYFSFVKDNVSIMYKLNLNNLMHLETLIYFVDYNIYMFRISSYLKNNVAIPRVSIVTIGAPRLLALSPTW